MSKIYQKHIPGVKTPVKRRFGGFTLIELLAVVLIIGILAAIAYPQYQKAVIKARIARVLPQLKAIQEAQERFYMANGHYTTEKDDLDINICREKQLTNMRTHASDGAIQLTPYTQLSLEQCLDFLLDDELLEVTPKSLRLRKKQLDPVKRKRESRS